MHVYIIYILNIIYDVHRKCMYVCMYDVCNHHAVSFDLHASKISASVITLITI